MRNADVCPTHFLSDAPASSDELGGTHEAIATSLLDLCLTSEGGRIIGLEGTWGSGKSTVLALMRNACKKDLNTAFLTFDAWAHQADPLRRVFLERLFASLKGLGWVSEEKWTVRLQELAGHRRTTRTIKHQKLTSFGKRLALAVAVAPTGMAFLGPEWRVNDLRLWLAWVVALAPVLVTVGHWLAKRDEASENVWALLVQNQTSEEESETVETPQPNSVEFERAFKEVGSEALFDQKRRIIICFDNLDRISAEAALEVWATLQAFVALSNQPDSMWFSRVWFVVPYDPTALARLWKGQNGSSDHQQDLAESFLTKAFALRFSVPPILLADWRKYLEGRLLAALPMHSDDVYSISRIYATERRQENLPPTPREITGFVNQLAAVHRHRGHEFSLPDMAYFVMLQRRVSNIAPLLLEKSVPTDSVLPFVSGSIADSLVALCFGTSATTARQHLLREPIEAALQNGDAAELERFLEIPGFWQVLETVESAPWMTTEGRHIALAAHALGHAGILEQNRNEVIQLRKRFLSAAMQITAWGTIDTEVAKGLLVMARLGAPQSLAALVTSIDKTAEGKDDLPTLEWVHGLKVFLDGVELAKLEMPQNVMFRIPGTAVDWMDVCSDIQKQGWSTERIRCMRPNRSSVDVANAVATEVTNQFSERAVAAAEVMGMSQDLYDAHQLPATIFARLRATTELGSDMFEQHLRVIEAFPPTGADDPSIDALRLQGWLHHHLSGYFRKNDDAGITSILLRLLPTHVPIVQPPSVANSIAGYQGLVTFLQNPESRPAVVQSLARASEQPERVSAWLQALDRDSKLLQSVQAILRELASNGRLSRVIGAKEIIGWWGLLEKTLEDAPAKLDELIADSTGEIIGLLENSEFDIDLLSFYTRFATVSRDKVASSNLAAICGAYFSGLNKEDWLAELRDPAETFELAGALQAGGVAVTFPIEFREAARSNSRELLEHKASAGPASKWPIVETSLDAESRSVLRDWVFDDLTLFGDGRFEPAFLESYARLFQDKDWLSTERRIAQNLARPIVETKDPATLRWLIQLAQDTPRMFQQLPRAHASDLVEKIEDSIEGADDEVKPLLEALKGLMPKRRAAKTSPKAAPDEG